MDDTCGARSGFKFGGLQDGYFTLEINAATSDTEGIYRLNSFSDTIGYIDCNFTYRDESQSSTVIYDSTGEGERSTVTLHMKARVKV